MTRFAATNRRLFFLFGLAVLPYLCNGYVNALVADNPLQYWAFELLTWVLVPAAIFVIARKRFDITLKTLGFTAVLFAKPQVPLLLALSLVFCPLSWYLYSSLHAFFSLFLPQEGIFQYESLIPDSTLLKLLVAVYFALSAGFVEEAIYRGFAFNIMNRVSSSIVPFMLFSPVIFAAAHWESGLANVAASYVFGLLAAAAYCWLRNLWPLVAGHVFTDYVWFG